MGGKPIALANEALLLFLHSLPIGSKFNIVSFGSEHEKMFLSSVDYNEQNLQYAEEEVKKFDADLGGTEILNPLIDIFQDQPDPNLPRHVYLLTDGAVQDTDEVIDLIKKNNTLNRVHAFGIGDGVSTELIKGCAQSGMGHYFFINNPKDIEKKVIEALNKDFLDYLKVSNIKLFDSNSDLVEEIQNAGEVSYGSYFKL